MYGQGRTGQKQQAHINLGNVYRCIGRIQEAMHEFELAFQARQKYENARQDIAIPSVITSRLDLSHNQK